MSFLNPMAGATDQIESPIDNDWWRGAAIYQIYPRSFQDSNNDGIGDLAGIIHRMEHIASLGVDAIWISPFFRSPMLDFGYDISDYRDVDPMFGTLGDFDALIQRAHELGIKVLIDLVLSHSSAEHPWFKESRSSRDNAKADYYVWADAKPDGSPPNNWLSIFGGSAWEWDAERMQYYLHNFLVEQPDLNFHNPEVRSQMLDIARYWLERGVDGFRLDTVNFYYHDAKLRDNPAMPADQQNANIAPSVNPYNFQDHQFDKNQPENTQFLEELRAVMDEFQGITSVGEVGDSHKGMEIQAEYTRGDDRLHMCYDFEFLSGAFPTGTRVASVLERAEEIVKDGWACWAFSNHDVARHASRWNMGEEERRVYAALLMSIKGSVCLYQGEELGLTEAYVAYEDLQDPYGKRFWPKFKGRDGCRTPMPWISDNQNGGFSDAQPWLPVAVEHLGRAVANQENDPDSTLGFYRAMLAFRKAHAPLRKGEIEILNVSDTMLAFNRTYKGATIHCHFNLSGSAVPLDLPKGDWKIDKGTPFTTVTTKHGLQLPPYQACFAVLQS